MRWMQIVGRWCGVVVLALLVYYYTVKNNNQVTDTKAWLWSRTEARHPAMLDTKRRQTNTTILSINSTNPNTWSREVEPIILSTKDGIPDEFVVPFSRQQRDALTLMLSAIHKIFSRRNITYLMCYGTALGSWRHHGLTPWDNDADLCTYIRDADAVWEALLTLQPRFVVAECTHHRLLRVRAKNPDNNETFRKPFIDVTFLKESDTTFISTVSVAKKFDKKFILPLRLRPFNGLLLWAPYDSAGYLNGMYENSIVTCTRDKHKMGEHLCESLFKFYPFVFRSSDEGVEELRVDGRVIAVYDPVNYRYQYIRHSKRSVHDTVQ